MIGLVLFCVALWGTTSATQVFFDAIMQHHPKLRPGKQSTFVSRLAFFVTLVGGLLAFAAVPYFILFGLPPK